MRWARQRTRTGVVAVVVGCLVLAAVVVAVVLTRGTPAPVARPAVTPAPVTTIPTSTPPLAPSTSAAPPPPHEEVPAAVPTSFELTGPRFTIKAHVCSMAPVFPLDPPGEQHHTVCWVTKGFGVKPGSDTATSYVLGHSWAEDDHEVLNKASALVTEQVLKTKKATKLDGVPVYPTDVLDGYTLTLHTPQGVLTYKIHSTYAVKKEIAANVTSAVDQKVPNRVVLITCAELHGRDYDYNIIANAYLYSSVRSANAA